MTATRSAAAPNSGIVAEGVPAPPAPAPKKDLLAGDHNQVLAKPSPSAIATGRSSTHRTAPVVPWSPRSAKRTMSWRPTTPTALSEPDRSSGDGVPPPGSSVESLRTHRSSAPFAPRHRKAARASVLGRRSPANRRPCSPRKSRLSNSPGPVPESSRKRHFRRSQLRRSSAVPKRHRSATTMSPLPWRTAATTSLNWYSRCAVTPCRFRRGAPDRPSRRRLVPRVGRRR